MIYRTSKPRKVRRCGLDLEHTHCSTVPPKSSLRNIEFAAESGEKIGLVRMRLGQLQKSTPFGEAFEQIHAHFLSNLLVKAVLVQESLNGSDTDQLPRNLLEGMESSEFLARL